MSVRAYKIIKTEIKEKATFNLWNHHWIVDNVEMMNQLNDCGSGIITIDEDAVYEAMKALRHEKNMSKAEKKENRAILKQMLADIGEETAVDYSCY